MPDTNPPSEDERIEKLVDEAVQKIFEHVESVRLCITYHEGDNSVTKMYSFGMGNFYAQRDSVREWLLRQDTHTQAAAWHAQMEDLDE